MKLSYKVILVAMLLASAPSVFAQTTVKTVSLNNLTRETSQQSYDVFVPIGKYIAQGDAESLSAWFADNLEISVLGITNDCSRKQGRQILKTFFSKYTPRDFTITHTAGRAGLKYALGTLSAGGESFLVTIFVSAKSSDHSTFEIQQFKIERLN